VHFEKLGRNRIYYIELINVLEVMIRGKIFRYTSILALSIAVTGLYIYYKRLHAEKEVIIQLAAYYPYNEHELRYNRYSFNRCGNYPDKFFPDSMLYVTLSDKLIASQLSQEIFHQSLGNFEEDIWSKKLSPFGFYETWLSIPDKYIAEFYESSRQYTNVFRVVFKQTRWRAAIIRDGKLVSDSVHLDVRTCVDALNKFEAIFLPDNKMSINDRIFDLKHLTRFELFVLLEQVSWLRAAVESNYRNSIHPPMERWADKLMKIELEKIRRQK
jgi:hypothetical protein